MVQKNLLIILSLVLLASCAGTPQTEPSEVAGATLVSDTLVVDADSPILSQITVAEVADTLFARTISTTGVVEAIPSCYAEVAAPFAGRVVRALVQIGQTVKKGAPLFEISSSDYSEVVKNYLQAQSQLALAQKTLARTQDLRDNNVASDKDLQQSQLDYSIALEEYNHAKATAHEYQIDLATAQVGQPMVVRSPISGRVLKADLVVGQYLKEDADARVVVADLSKVWVNVNIAEKDAPFVDGVEDAQVRLVANADSVFHGRITYCGGMLDPETRTMSTLVECLNPRGKMLPNMYAHVELACRPSRQILVPKSAVTQADAYRFVTRQIGERRFVRTAVTVETASTDHYVVISGLSRGDKIITQGAYLLVDIK